MPKVQFESVTILTNQPNQYKPILLAPFFELYAVLRENGDPKNILLEHMRNNARVMGIWPDQIALLNRYYKLHKALVLLMLTIFWSTIACELYCAVSDIVVIGESLMFLMGVSLVYFKVLLTLKNWPKINEIIEILIDLNLKSANFKHEKIAKMQRNYFIGERLITTFFHIMAFLLFATLNIQPLLTDQTIPLPALFPFNLQNPVMHPWGSKFVYGYQAFAIGYSLLLILYVDTLGGASITQTSMILKILSLRLRELGLNRAKDFNMLNELRELVEFHQKIINVNNMCNDAFHGTYILQMGTSTFMLGLAGFETLYNKDEPMVAFKFLFFMLVSTMQLLYWCMIGNMVYFDSQDVSVAAFEAHEWFDQSPVVQRNLMFVIFRAQKPLVFRAKPFMPFTFETFAKIIKTSYTSFTLLCNTSE